MTGRNNSITSEMMHSWVTKEALPEEITEKIVKHWVTGKAVASPTKPLGPWTICDMQTHLQWAVDIEHYTILYYMSAWFSIKDQGAEAARLIKSIVNQEMLHMQCAANLANAFGAKLTITPPLYGVPIPHLDFALNKVNPSEIFAPYSTEIGAFDVQRLNTMCIIEFPDWFEESDRQRFLKLAVDEAETEDKYGTIGQLYDAIKSNMEEPQIYEYFVPNRKQVDFFAGFYPEVQLKITDEGEDGLKQARGLIDLIVAQGEGQLIEKGDNPSNLAFPGEDGPKQEGVPIRFQNPVNDLLPNFDHFDKFTYLRGQPMPETWELTIGDPAGKAAQKALRDHYARFVCYMNALFGEPAFALDVKSMGPYMFNIGAAVADCWRNGALPGFSLTDSQCEDE